MAAPLVQTLIALAYLVAASLFILGLKRLTSPATAPVGNRLSATGMLVAVLATLFLQEILSPVHLVGGLAAGALIGAVLARRVSMTGMPELVAVFNGFGGIASTFVAGAEIARAVEAVDPEVFALGGTLASVVPVAVQGVPAPLSLDVGVVVTIALSLLIGTVTFSGSFVAFGKLGGFISGNPVTFTGMRALTAVVALAILTSAVLMVLGVYDYPEATDALMWGAICLTLLALVLGVLLVVPIGGADMPVVVALLNSYSGLAAAATGFVLDNTALVVSGALVGASGLILTRIMCEAMNRSLVNVLLGGFGGSDGGGTATVGVGADGRAVAETTVDDTAILLAYADRVVVVPGYGMAVAQAQHQVRELVDLLQAKGVQVKYAIHPVAGRMPGHMNVLLAEANVPYDQLYEMDDVNGEFASSDVALVIGANDVVNPAARHDASSPIYGMPILNVDEAKTVIVLKRSMRPGYSGVENELFFGANTRMLFGDAKESLAELVGEVKAL